MEAPVILEAINTITVQHNKLIRQLEGRYKHHLANLMKQKSLIHQHIQKQFYQQLLKLIQALSKAPSKKYIHPFTSNKPNHTSQSPKATAIPRATTASQLNYDQYRSSITQCPQCGHKNQTLRYMCHHIRNMHPDLDRKLIKHKVFGLCSKCHGSYHCTQRHQCNPQRLKSLYTAPQRHPSGAQSVWNCDLCNARCKSKKNFTAHIKTHSTAHLHDCALRITMKTVHQRFMDEGKFPGSAPKHKEVDNSLPPVIEYTHSIAKTNMNPQVMDTAKPVTTGQPSAVKQNKGTKYKVLTTNHCLRYDALAFQCPICHKEFKFKWYLKRHLKIHQGSKEFVCTKCNKPFKRKDSLQRHMKAMHLNERNKAIRCRYCPYSTAYKSTMQTHEDIHTRGTKSAFACKYCTFSAQNNTILKRHLLLHNTAVNKPRNNKNKTRTRDGNGKFGCNVCSKQFKTQIDLNVHRRVHTRERAYKCRKCGKTFADSASLDLHVSKHRSSLDRLCL